MRAVLLGILIFIITVAETAVATFGGRADRQATSAKDNRFSLKTANWEATYEAILVVDIISFMSNPIMYAPVVVVAAWLGKYWAVERRRKKWRARVNKPKDGEDEDG